MKYKTITFSFSKPVTKEQELILIGFFQGIRDHIKKKLKKTINAMRGPLQKTLGGPQTETIMVRMQNARARLRDFLVLNKIDETTYVFKVAHEDLQPYNTKGLPFMDKLDFWPRLKGRVLKMKEEIIKEMGLLDSELTVTAED